jgi:hypothetical protein
LAIVGGVACANIYYEITDNPYLVGIVGVALALVATQIASSTIDTYLSLRQRLGLLRGEKSAEQLRRSGRVLRRRH